MADVVMERGTIQPIERGDKQQNKCEH